MAMIPKGTIIKGPNGQSYEMAENHIPGVTPQSEQFIAHGGAPKPVTGGLMPHWLTRYIFEQMYEEKDDRG